MFRWITGATHCVPEWSWTVAAGQHHGWTIWYVADGEGTLRIGQQVYGLSAGDLFFLDYREPVRGTQGAKPLRVYYLDFTPEDEALFRSLPVHVTVESNVFTEKLFLRVLEAKRNNHPEGMALWAGAVVEELRTASRFGSHSYHHRKLEELAARMHRNPGMEWHVGELARSMHLSTDYLIRIFSEQYGLTPYQYLLSLRLEAAKGLLRSSDLRVEEIAVQTGFPNIYTFSRFFRKHTGLSPTAYRKAKETGEPRLAVHPEMYD